jgi:hypothetical protein
MMKTSQRILAVRALLVFAGVLAISGCNTTDDTTDKKKAAETKPAKRKVVTTMPDQGGDVAFQSFISRLRQAIAAKDTDAIAGMMTTDFGYHINPDLEGPGVFAYWDQNNIWPELQLVIREHFVPFGDARDGFMVAPVEFTTAADYAGYRAGVRLVNGAWKFAYFVNGTE